MPQASEVPRPMRSACRYRSERILFHRAIDPARLARVTFPQRCLIQRLIMTHDDRATGASPGGVGLLDLDRGLACWCPSRVHPGLFLLVGSSHLLYLALADGGDRDLHDLPPVADSSKFRVATEMARVSPDDHRELCLRRRAVGWVADHRRHHAHSDEEDDAHTPNEGFFWAHMYWWVKVDANSEHSPEYSRNGVPISAGSGPPLARSVPFHLPSAALRGTLLARWDDLAGLGRVRAFGLRAPLDVAGQLGHPHLGISAESDPRQLHEPLVGRSSHLWRGLA